MRRYLALVSVMCITLCSMAQSHVLQVPDTGRLELRTSINVHDNQLSGITIIKQVDGCVKGIMMNEFGIKVLAFELSRNRNKIKLTDVVALMNHWWIKRIVKSDIKYLFNVTTDQIGIEKNRRKVITANGVITLENSRHDITYTFGPMDESQNREEKQDEIEE